MLQYRAVYPETLELLKILMKYDSLRQTFLVGGTALALQLGHRISVDIDLFSETDFDTNEILSELRQDLELQVIIQKEKNSLIINARKKNTNNEFVKVDFVKYAYPLLKELKNEDGIRLLSVEDIIPMKLSAIANRGAKKDFFDIYELMKTYSLSDMFELFSKKYPDTAHFHILKSLTYFDDAEEDFDPITLLDTDWEIVKQTIENKVNKFV
ncbi:MAG: nucleotidyl transferase AbiEii/AbiGii toxin family protein [Salinivirgaceae bacterium]|jgi:predicted nucleotidyltransferase component of viral defense system|nr:nucleotidyl transferase AbiEii/AbiGii toxin family protein [Bacteroidales bacterium]